MVLTYLHRHFLEERQFAEAIQSSPSALQTRISARVCPAPSYVFASKGRVTSFVADTEMDETYRFHLRGHIDWHRDLLHLGILSEDHARAHFFARYGQAMTMFRASDLGRDLMAEMPEVIDRFDDAHAQATWAHFLNGVYGVCTRDGRPEAVFLKQAGVMFVETLIADGPEALSKPQKALLGRAVTTLDRVEADFAPHEVAQTSRQRCITEVRARFLGSAAA